MKQFILIMCYVKKDINMNEVELYLIEEGDNCTLYTLQFLNDTDNEFEKFVSKFVGESEYNEDYLII